jgi:hypothetical protein
MEAHERIAKSAGGGCSHLLHWFEYTIVFFLELSARSKSVDYIINKAQQIV